MPVLPSRRGAEAGGFSVDAQTRNAVAAFYQEVYTASEGIPAGWDGDVASCDEGTISNDYRNAALRRINFFRAMCSLPANINLDTNWNNACQEAALMMSANGALSHYPPTSWTCWTWDGSNAASHANIALGSDGAESIDRFISDTGVNNYPCGHRRWLLCPREQTMGIGSLPESAGYDGACAVWVIGGFGSTPPTPAYVPWPNEGFCPYNLAYERWSFSMSNANFSAATVSMSSNGSPVSVTKETVVDGYGDNTLVWKVSGFPLSGISTDITFTVSVSNIVVGGKTTNFTYNVTLMDPNTVPEVIQISGPGNPWVSNSASYAFTAVPYATAYVVRTSLLVPSTWFEGAEAGTNYVSPHVVDGYAFITNSIKASGTYSFHIAAGWDPQYFVLNRIIRPETNASLMFKTRMRWATTGQSSSAGVSTDEGNTWITVWEKIGTNGNMDSTFESHSIGLGSYAGQNLRVRFMHESSGSSYVGTSDLYGVFVDDISVSNCQDLADAQTQVVFTNAFVLNPSDSSDYLLEAAPILGGRQYDYGSSLMVSPSDLWFTGMRISGGNIVLDFNTHSGLQYRFYGASGLVTNDWGSPVSTPTANGNSCTVTGALTEVQKFYRIIQP